MDLYVTKPVRIDELNKVLEPLMTRAAEPLAATDLIRPVAPAGTAAPSAVILTEALEVVGGDVDILREAVSLSLAEIPEQLAELKAALEQPDAKRVEAAAHRLKGVMGNLGGMAAREVGQQLETMGSENNLSRGRVVLKTFEQESARVVAFYSTPNWEQLARQCQEALDA